MEWMKPIAVFLNDYGAVDRIRFWHWSDKGSLCNIWNGKVNAVSDCIQSVSQPCKIVAQNEDLTLEEAVQLNAVQYVGDKDKLYLNGTACLTIVDYLGRVRKDALQVAVYWLEMRTNGRMKVPVALFVDWQGKSVVCEIEEMKAKCSKSGISLGHSRGAKIFLDSVTGLEYASEEKRSEVNNRISLAEFYNLKCEWRAVDAELELIDYEGKELTLPDLFDSVNVASGSINRLCCGSDSNVRVYGSNQLKELTAPSEARVWQIFDNKKLESLSFGFPKRVVPQGNKPSVISMQMSKYPYTELDMSGYIATVSSIFLHSKCLKRAVITLGEQRAISECHLYEASHLEYVRVVIGRPRKLSAATLCLDLRGLSRDVLIDWAAPVESAIMRLELRDLVGVRVIRVKSCVSLGVTPYIPFTGASPLVIVIEGDIRVSRLSSKNYFDSLMEKYELRFYDVDTQESEDNLLSSFRSTLSGNSSDGVVRIVRENFLRNA